MPVPIASQINNLRRRQLALAPMLAPANSKKSSMHGNGCRTLCAAPSSCLSKTENQVSQRTFWVESTGDEHDPARDLDAAMANKKPNQRHHRRSGRYHGSRAMDPLKPCPCPPFRSFGVHPYSLLCVSFCRPISGSAQIRHELSRYANHMPTVPHDIPRDMSTGTADIPVCQTYRMPYCKTYRIPCLRYPTVAAFIAAPLGM